MSEFIHRLNDLCKLHGLTPEEKETLLDEVVSYSNKAHYYLLAANLDEREPENIQLAFKMIYAPSLEQLVKDIVKQRSIPIPHELKAMQDHIFVELDQLLTNVEILAEGEAFFRQRSSLTTHDLLQEFATLPVAA